MLRLGITNIKDLKSDKKAYQKKFEIFGCLYKGMHLKTYGLGNGSPIEHLILNFKP